jgi:hypothetical protein
MLPDNGVNKVLGADGIEGTTRWFEGLGFRPAWLHARVAATTEFGAGDDDLGSANTACLRGTCEFDDRRGNDRSSGYRLSSFSGVAGRTWV